MLRLLVPAQTLQLTGAVAAVLVLANLPDGPVADPVPLPDNLQLPVVVVFPPHLPDQVDELLEDEEADHGGRPHKPEPDQLVVLRVVVVVVIVAVVT